MQLGSCGGSGERVHMRVYSYVRICLSSGIKKLVEDKNAHIGNLNIRSFIKQASSTQLYWVTEVSDYTLQFWLLHRIWGLKLALFLFKNASKGLFLQS